MKSYIYLKNILIEYGYKKRFKFTSIKRFGDVLFKGDLFPFISN